MYVDWRRDLAALEEKYRFVHVTPYEKNIEIWRQLWIVIERSDILVQIVDCRDPMFFRCPDLEKYVKEVGKEKVNFLLLNKADLLDNVVRESWSQYLNKEGIHHIFFSAKQQQHIIDRDLEEATASAEELNKIVNTPNIVNRGTLKAILKKIVTEFKQHHKETLKETSHISDIPDSKPAKEDEKLKKEEEKPHVVAQMAESFDETLGDKPVLPQAFKSTIKILKVSPINETLAPNLNTINLLEAIHTLEGTEECDQHDCEDCGDDCPECKVPEGEEPKILEPILEPNEHQHRPAHLKPSHKHPKDSTDHIKHADGQPVHTHTKDEIGEKSGEEEKEEEKENEPVDIYTKLGVDRHNLISKPFFEKRDEDTVSIGMIGFPNVGKSSVINVLCNKKLVGVGSRPGKTKNFQTIFLEKDLILCDCPGLVFPSIVHSKAQMVTQPANPRSATVSSLLTTLEIIWPR